MSFAAFPDLPFGSPYDGVSIVFNSGSITKILFTRLYIKPTFPILNHEELNFKKILLVNEYYH